VDKIVNVDIVEPSPVGLLGPTITSYQQFTAFECATLALLDYLTRADAQ